MTRVNTRCLFCPYLLSISPTFGSLGGLCFVIVAFPRYPHYILYLYIIIIIIIIITCILPLSGSLVQQKCLFYFFFYFFVVFFCSSNGPLSRHWYWNNVDLTLIQLQDVQSTFNRRCFNVVFLLGWHQMWTSMTSIKMRIWSRLSYSLIYLQYSVILRTGNEKTD